jgi:hypothetical protein
MSSRVATLKRGIVLASAVVSSYAVFGQDAWAPEPAYVAQNLNSGTTTVTGYYTPSGQSTTVVKWPAGWTVGSPEAGKPCSAVDIPEGTVTTSTIERYGNYARCTTWTSITPGARLEAALSGTGTTAPATTLTEPPLNIAVVQFPAAWTYDTTVAAETYCATFPASAGTIVGMTIVRAGNYAKCTY